jgi:hypothetical protein
MLREKTILDLHDTETEEKKNIAAFVYNFIYLLNVNLYTSRNFSETTCYHDLKVLITCYLLMLEVNLTKTKILKIFWISYGFRTNIQYSQKFMKYKIRSIKLANQ